MKKILCFFGKHDFQHSSYFEKRIVAVGDKCTRCGMWHESALRMCL